MKKMLYKFSLPCIIAVFAMSCEKEVEGLGEMKDKGKVVYVNATVNNSSTPVLAAREVAIFPVYNGIDFNNFPIQFPWSNGYKAFDPGTLNMRFDTVFSPGSNPFNYNGRTAVMSFPLQLQADRYYSLYSVGTINAVDTFFIEDDLSLPPAGKAKILFLNLSLDAGAIDIVNASTGAVLASNITYKQRRAYVVVDPGTIRLQINAAGTSTVLRASRDVLIEPNSVYTVWARGLRTPPQGALANHPLQLSYHANRWSY